MGRVAVLADYLRWHRVRARLQRTGDAFKWCVSCMRDLTTILCSDTCTLLIQTWIHTLLHGYRICLPLVLLLCSLVLEKKFTALIYCINFHTQSGRWAGGCLACWSCKIDSRLSWDCVDLYYARGAHGVLPIIVGSATNQLDLPSLTPLSVAGCGRLQLEVPHLGYFSRLLQVVENWPHILW